MFDPYIYKATVTRVVDGDTVDLVVDLGLGVASKQRCRLYGINAPETRGRERKRGLMSSAHLTKILEQYCSKNSAVGYEVTIRTHKDKRGKYGRYLVEIFGVDGMDANQNAVYLNGRMVEDGHAKAYLTGK